VNYWVLIHSAQTIKIHLAREYSSRNGKITVFIVGYEFNLIFLLLLFEIHFGNKWLSSGSFYWGGLQEGALSNPRG
jgi:hypothetical protein